MSAAYVNLVLFFLHTRTRPLIPNLQDQPTLTTLSPTIHFETLRVEGHNISYCNDLPLLRRDIMPVYITHCFDVIVMLGM